MTVAVIVTLELKMLLVAITFLKRLSGTELETEEEITVELETNKSWPTNIIITTLKKSTKTGSSDEEDEILIGMSKPQPSYSDKNLVSYSKLDSGDSPVNEQQITMVDDNEIDSSNKVK